MKKFGIVYILLVHDTCMSSSFLGLYNTKPAPSLPRTFSRRNGRKKKRSCNKMVAPEASVHPVRNRLCYHFFLYLTNESCSRIVSRRLMLLRSLNKSYLRVKCCHLGCQLPQMHLCKPLCSASWGHSRI